MRPWQKAIAEWPGEQLVAGATTLLGAAVLFVFACLWLPRLLRSRRDRPD